MAKYSVNLMIGQHKELPLIRSLRTILPVAAAFSLFIFIVLFIWSVIYTNNNIAQFNVLKKEVEALEQKIIAQKNSEGLYILTAGRLNTLSQLTEETRDFSKTLNVAENFSSKSINLVAGSVNKKGELTLSFTASSSGDLDDLVMLLIMKNREKVFSDIQASGIVRDKKGNYSLSVFSKASKELMQ